MNTAVISREEILSASRSIVSEQGLSSVNMRLVASRCGIALGSIYNYFPSKSELMLATIESVWKDIFHENGKEWMFDSFLQCVEWLFFTIRSSSEKYPEFFTVHSMMLAAEDRTKGQRLMKQSLEHLKRKLLEILKKDEKVDKRTFSESLTPEIFIEYAVTLLFALLLEKKESCQPLLNMIEQCIYRRNVNE